MAYMKTKSLFCIWIPWQKNVCPCFNSMQILKTLANIFPHIRLVRTAAARCSSEQECNNNVTSYYSGIETQNNQMNSQKGGNTDKASLKVHLSYSIDLCSLIRILLNYKTPFISNKEFSLQLVFWLFFWFCFWLGVFLEERGMSERSGWFKFLFPLRTLTSYSHTWAYKESSFFHSLHSLFPKI